MRLVWGPESISDLAALRAHIAEDDPVAGRRMALRIVEAVETLLPEHPEIGRPGRVTGTRELVVSRTPYLVPYRLRGDTVEILRVYHAARRWPDRF